MSRWGLRTQQDEKAIADGDAAYDRMLAEGWGGTCDDNGHVVRSGMEGNWPEVAWKRFQEQADLVDYAADILRFTRKR